MFAIETMTAVAQQMPTNLQIWLFFAFFLGFAIKVPMFPFHVAPMPYRGPDRGLGDPAGSS